jgi:hypothetical protein
MPLFQKKKNNHPFPSFANDGFGNGDSDDCIATYKDFTNSEELSLVEFYAREYCCVQTLFSVDIFLAGRGRMAGRWKRWILWMMGL